MEENKSEEKKSGKLKMIVIVVGLLVIIIVGLWLYLLNNTDLISSLSGIVGKNSEVFVADEDYKYIFITDYRFKTMLNDGGSNTSFYYAVDLKNKFVIKYTDKYVGFSGYEYKGKEVYRKSLTDNQIKEIEEIFDDIVNNRGEDLDYKKSNYMYYTLETNKYASIEYNNYEMINKFEEIVK